VNAISPGVTETQGFRELMNSTSASDIETQRQRAISSIPLGRLGTPDDIAKVVVFLASEDSSYIAGAEISVDGGFAQV
jgi:NAD(P)-dependent dehydrogenase (short-subunit alcohol dehydrogenase family)